MPRSSLDTAIPDANRTPLGQRFLLWLFRASAVILVLAGLFILGGWRLGKELVRSEPGVWAGPILQFLFALGATWLAAGVGQWLEGVRAEVAAPNASEEAVPPGIRFYLEDWIPAMVLRADPQAARVTWITVVYAAWLPFLLLAAGDRDAPMLRRARRWISARKAARRR